LSDLSSHASAKKTFFSEEKSRCLTQQIEQVSRKNVLPNVPGVSTIYQIYSKNKNQSLRCVLLSHSTKPGTQQKYTHKSNLDHLTFITPMLQSKRYVQTPDCTRNRKTEPLDEHALCRRLGANKICKCD
jgi:hypothetical protein